MNRVLTLCFVSLLALPLANAYAAEAESSATSDPDPTETVTSESEEVEPAPTVEAPPTDTLGGSGLKSRQLSDIFEQFVPSETISADNAVPFPVDI